MKIVCPYCGVRGTLADSFVQKNIRCPRCKRIFRAETEVEFTPIEEAAPPTSTASERAAEAEASPSPMPATKPPPVPSPPSQRIGQPTGQRPERIVVPPDVKLNTQPLGKIRQEAEPLEVDVLYGNEAEESVLPPAVSRTTSEAVSQVSPQVQPQTAPSGQPPAASLDLTEDQVHASLDTLFESKSLCDGCGCQAGDDEEFLPGRAGLLCPACRAAEEAENDFAQPDSAQPADDWGAARTASGWRPEDELREMAMGGKRRAAGPNARFTVFPILREAWEKLEGVKSDVWGAVAIIILVNLIFASVIHFLPNTKTDAGIIALSAVGVIAFFINSLLLSGLCYLGLCRARGQESGWDTMFVSFSPLNLVKLLPLFILLPVVIGVGLVCLIVPGIYLAVTLSFSPLLVLDQGMWPWAAMLESRRESHVNWLNIFWVYLVLKVAFWAAVLCLLVGLFWMLPFVFVAYGVVHRRLFDGA